MVDRAKIKIVDDKGKRDKIQTLYTATDQVVLAQWSILMAKHIFLLVGIDYKTLEPLVKGFEINELWQIGKTGQQEVRQWAFKIHALAREREDEVLRSALRLAGHAVASGHMGEHAMIASDYAIKVINLLMSNDLNAISLERQWQLDQLKTLIVQSAPWPLD